MCSALVPFFILNLKGLCGGNHYHPGFPWELRGMAEHVSQADAGAEQVGNMKGYWVYLCGQLSAERRDWSSQRFGHLLQSSL